MKDCANCKHLYKEGYEDYYYTCALFGENIPKWANNNNDSCLLKSNEVDKAIRLQNNISVVDSGKELNEFDFPKWTKKDKKQNEKALKKYNDYIEQLKVKCIKRKNK